MVSAAPKILPANGVKRPAHFAFRSLKVLVCLSFNGFKIGELFFSRFFQLSFGGEVGLDSRAVAPL